MTLIQAQQRYINRVNAAHPGHFNRVHRSARAQLWQWAIDRGFDTEGANAICRDAKDVAALERNEE